MKLKMTFFATLAALAFAVEPVNAASLVSNHDALSKSGAQTAEFDFLNEKNVYGVQFDVVFAKGVSGVNAENCLAALPKAFSMSRCQVVDNNRVRVMVLSGEQAVVPDGQIAKISFDASGLSGKDAFVVEDVIFGSRAGERIEPNFVDRTDVPDFGPVRPKPGRQVQ